MTEDAHGSRAVGAGEVAPARDAQGDMAVSALCHGLKRLSTTAPATSPKLPLAPLLEDVRIASSLAALNLRACASSLCRLAR